MLTKKILFIVWLLGIMIGFTLMISGNTLNYWLAKENVNIKTIGIFALISLPYAINFIWAPIFDTKKLPIFNKMFGQRLSWVIMLQFFLSTAIYLMSTLNPLNELMPIAICGLMVSFLASAQDTVLGALRTELVQKNQQGEISGMYIFGYRIGMLLSGSGAIYISQYISWNLVYELFSMIVFIFPIILILFANDLSPIESGLRTISSSNTPSTGKYSIRNLIADIVNPIGHSKYIVFILIFLVLYRLPDNFITMMINPFLIHIGYDEFEISTAGKLLGITSAMLGGLLASFIMKKKNLFDSLLLFGSIHAVAHILFVVQDIYGKNLYLLFIMTGFESISGGMTMAAYIAYIASLCHGKFRATQYSFLSSMMGLSRAVLPAISGYIVASFGWTVFYLFTTLATVPSLVMILYLEKMHKQTTKRD